MKVSVCITAYNHEPYIAQALDSVLAQETSFDYEILIGEDDSTDRTREIVKIYKKKYPDKIRLFLNSRDDVIYINDVATGAWNFINNLKNARGEYIALLDGDDYWVSKNKLENQVSFLENNEDYVGCFHNISVIENGNVLIKYKFPEGSKEVYEIDDLLLKNFIPTCTAVFRNIFKGDIPKMLYEPSMGDWPLHIFYAQYGLIRYIPEIFGVHRIHSSGYWNSMTELERLDNILLAYDIFKSGLNNKFYDLLEIGKAQHILKAYREALSQDDFRIVMKYLWLYLREVRYLKFNAFLPELEDVKSFITYCIKYIKRCMG